MTWLGVDLGNARVGLALSDPEHTVAHPIGNIRAYGDSFHAIDDVIGVIEDEQVDHVVVGLPLLLSGEEGASAKKARRWARNLGQRISRLIEAGESPLTTPPAITMIDERLTTVSAHRQLRQTIGAERNHRAVVDQQSAVVILQTALDSEKQ